MKLVVKWLAIMLFTVLFLTISSIGLLLFSSWGVSAALWGVQKVVPHFYVENTEGQLLDGLLLEGVDIQIAGADIKAKKLFFDLSTQCLLSRRVCVDALEADTVRVAVEKTSSEQTKSNPLTELRAPYPIQISNLKLTDVYIDAMGYQFSSGHLATGVDWIEDTATLKPTQWQEVAIILPKMVNEKNEAKSAEIAKPLVLPEVSIPLKVVIEDIAISNVKLNNELVLASLNLKAEAQGTKVSLSHFLLDAPQGKLTASADANLTGDYPLALNAKVNVKQKPLQQHDLALKIQGDLKNLNIDANLAGKLKARLSGKVDVLDPNFPYVLTLKSQHLQWPIDKADYQLNSTTIDSKGDLTAYQASVSTRIKGKGIPNTKVSTMLKGDLTSIALNKLKVDTLAGNISGNAKASWGEQITWQSALNFKNIQPGTFWKEAEGQLSGNFVQQGKFNVRSGWSVNASSLDIKGIIREQALTLKGKVKASGNPEKGTIFVDTDGLALRHGKNSLSVKGKIDEKIALTLNVNIPSLASSLPQMKGNIKGNIDLSGTLKKPKASMNLTASSLVYGDKVLAIRKADIRGSLVSMPMISGRMAVNVRGIKANGVDFNSVNLNLSGDEKKHNLSLVAKGEPISKELNIVGGLTEKMWRGTVAKSNVETPLGKWKLSKNVPISFNLKNSNLTLGSLCWQRSKSRICIDETQVQNANGKTRFAINNFDLVNLNKFLAQSTKIRGKLNGNADISWQENALPKVDLNFTLSKGRAVQRIDDDQQRLQLRWEKVDLTGSVKNDKLSSKLVLDLAENGSVVFDLIMDKLSQEKPTVNSHFSANKVNLAALAPALEKNAKLGGILNGGFSLKGNLKAPKAVGRLELSNLSLQSLNSPIVISGGSVVMRMNGQAANLSGKVITTDGQLNLKGNADWHQVNAWSMSLNTSSKRLTLALPPMINMQVSPNLTMKASPKLVEVTGKVGIPWGRIQVTELPATAVKVSGDVVILNEKREPIKTETSTALPFNADIGIELGEDVRLEAFGLSTNLAGNLRVDSSQRGTNVLGEITLNEGVYRSFGQDLKIKTGLIRFNGPAEQPYLQIVAIRNPNAIEDDVEAGIRVLGTPDAPNIEIYSVPVMAQANALSYLTRGRNLDSDAGGSAMTSMLIGLGLSQSGMLVGKIGEAFGVKDLSVDTAGQGDNEQVVVSGYILPGLQVKYGVGIFTSIPEFTLRYNLLKNLYLEAVSGADTAVDLLYQFSIE